MSEMKTAESRMAAAMSEIKSALERRDAELKKYGESLTETDAKIDKLNEALCDAAQLKERLERLETAANRPDTKVDDDATDTKAAEFKAAFGGYLRKGTDALSPEQKVLVAGSNVGGGYLLAPPEMVGEVIKTIDEFSPIRSVARVRQTSNPSVKVPTRTATYTASWAAESGSRSETTGLTFGLEEIPTHELYARVDVSWQELEDAAFDLEAFLAEEFAMQFAVAEGLAFTTGSAVGRPEGFVTKLTAASAYTALGHASTINSLDGLIDLQHAIKTGHASQAVWGMRRATIGILRKAKGGDGQYLWEPAAQSADPMNFLGNRIVEMPDMAAVTTNSYSVVFGNFRNGYLIVDRIGLEIIRDPYSSKSTGAVEFLARKRVGGQVVLQEALRLGKVATS